jgi:hypothetical protein
MCQQGMIGCVSGKTRTIDKFHAALSKTTTVVVSYRLV